MGVVASKDQSLQADERTAAFTNETIPHTKKRRTGKINIRINLITAGSYFVRYLHSMPNSRGVRLRCCSSLSRDDPYKLSLILRPGFPTSFSWFITTIVECTAQHYLLTQRVFPTSASVVIVQVYIHGVVSFLFGSYLCAVRCFFSTRQFFCFYFGELFILSGRFICPKLF